MLRDKGTENLSELKNFFIKENKAFFALLKSLTSLKFESKHFGFSQANNEKITSKNKLILLILFPFFAIKNPYNYCKSIVYDIFSCQKDVFYRLVKNPNIQWRKLVQSLTKQLIYKSEKSNKEANLKLTKCLIIDDTDIPKTGRKMECIGKVFSHVKNKFTLGFKGLFLGYTDGTSFFPYDVSLKGEQGKRKDKPQGLNPKQIKKRFDKNRDKNSEGFKRLEEYFLSKITIAQNMIKRALKTLSVDYVLVDSWFTCYDLVKFIAKHKSNIHFLGMIKMGKTSYKLGDKNKTAKGLIKSLKDSKKQRYCKCKKLYHSECIVFFKDVQVKLFFYKRGQGDWRGLMSTDLNLSFDQAYDIYALRWSIEVFFKEAKQYLGLGKNQSVDFDSQIASISITMLQYSLLSFNKRITDYQTIGGLFKDVQNDTLELTFSNRIYLIIRDVVSVLADLFQSSEDVIISRLIADNQDIIRIFKLYRLKEAS